MKKFKFGERVIYTGSSNTWTFDKDLLTNHKGKIYQVIETPGIRSYMVDFENGLEASIDQRYLKPYFEL